MQEAYNKEHGITPTTVKRNIKAGIEAAAQAHRKAREAIRGEPDGQVITDDYLKMLEQEMLQAAEDLEFERAASLRDKLLHLREHVGEVIAESVKSTTPKAAAVDRAAVAAETNASRGPRNAETICM